jgi:hypothetical protein
MSGVVFAPSPSPVASVEAGGPHSSPAVRDTRFLVAHAGIFVPAHDLQARKPPESAQGEIEAHAAARSTGWTNATDVHGRRMTPLAKPMRASPAHVTTDLERVSSPQGIKILAAWTQ